MQTLSKAQARRISLYAQGFGDSPPKGNVTRVHLRRAMNRMQLLQLDSVPVVIRSQFLPLYSRLGPYRNGLLTEMQTRHGEWFECWSHEANLMPVNREPLFRWRKARSARGETWKSLYQLAQEEKDYVASVLAQVEERGPLAASDLPDPRMPKKRGTWWAGRSLGQHALDWLYRIGRLGVIRDEHFHRKYDVLERVVPDSVLATPSPTEDDALRALVIHAAESMGIATAADLADYFRLPIRETRRLIPEAVESGRIEEVEVEDWGAPAYRYVDAKLPRRVAARAFLSPFDPVVWCRPRALRLFDFEYRIEIYVPAPKRVYGYYVLPFLVGDRIAGRVDLKTHRDRRVLEVRGAFVEDGEDASSVAAEMAAELPRLAMLVGADSIDVTCRKNFGRKIARALR